MPPKIALVREAIARLDTIGRRGGPPSKVHGLDSKTFEQLCERLADRRIAWLDSWRWLIAELGETEATASIKQDVIYRFVGNFAPVFEQVQAEHAQRIARLTVEHATAGNVVAMTQVSKHRLANLFAEKLIATNTLDDLSPSQMASMLAMVRSVDEGQIKQQELALKVDDSERKAMKLEADLEVIRQRVARLPEQVKALEARIESVSAAVQSGKKIDPAIFAQIRRELIALATPSGEGGVAA